jgi:hypothetical protein
VSKRIALRIRADGSIEAQTQGMKGPECLSYIEAIERLTGAQAVESWYTPEFYEVEHRSDEALENEQQGHDVQQNG